MLSPGDLSGEPYQTRTDEKSESVYAMQAAAYLKRKRYIRSWEQNFRCRQGEIDLIARDGGYLVFIEVKYRSSLKRWRSHLRAVVQVGGNRERSCGRQSINLRTHPEQAALPCRFDVIGMEDCGAPGAA